MVVLKRVMARPRIGMERRGNQPCGHRMRGTFRDQKSGKIR